MASEFLIEDAVIWTSSRPSPQPGYMAVCDGVIAAIGSGAYLVRDARESGH
jgi:predicted amidohydrolase YtcJ